MSIECSECEMDARSGHSEDCSIGLKFELAEAAQRNRELTRQVEQLQKIVKACEFDPHGYCPICGGWECEKGRGCTPRKHTKDCALVAALTAPPSSAPTDPGRADTKEKRRIENELFAGDLYSGIKP